MPDSKVLGTVDDEVVRDLDEELPVEVVVVGQRVSDLVH